MINNEGSFNFDEIIAKDLKKNGTVAIILKLSMKKHFSLIFFKDGKISHAIKKKYLKTFDKTIGSCSWLKSLNFKVLYNPLNISRVDSL